MLAAMMVVSPRSRVSWRSNDCITVEIIGLTDYPFHWSPHTLDTLDGFHQKIFVGN